MLKRFPTNFYFIEALPDIFAYFLLQKELPFRSRSTSPSRSPSRRRSRSPSRRSRSRSRSPARGRGRPPARKTSEETFVEKITQQTEVTPSRRSPRRGRMPEKKVEESSTTTTAVTKDKSSESSSITTVRVTRSVTKKLLAEEKESLLTAEMKPTIKSTHGYEFGGPFGVLFMMITLPALVVSSYLFCSGRELCTVRQLPSLPPLWKLHGGFFDIGHLIVDGWILLQAFIYILPIGKVCILLLLHLLKFKPFNFSFRDGAVVRALAFHRCVPGSIPGPGVICGLSLLLVLFSAPRGFSPGTPVFPSPQKPAFLNSNSSLESVPN